MNYPLQIGVTGGIGAGKSIVCQIFNRLGVPVYDADSRAKNLMTTDKILISGIQKEFGSLSYGASGELNRAYLSSQTFGKPDRLEALNRIVHPRVAADYKEWAMSCNEVDYIIKEAALLFETESYKQLDKIVVITAPEEVRIARVLERDRHRSKDDVRKIIESQLGEEEKKKRADHIIVNDESVLVIPQVLKLHEIFSKN